MIRLPKLLVSIFIFSIPALLCLPIAAQDMMAMERLYCPYCEMANLTTSKFCSVCGTRLPQSLSPSSMPGTTMINDSLGAKVLYDNEIVQHYRQQGSIAGSIAGGL